MLNVRSTGFARKDEIIGAEEEEEVGWKKNA